MSKVPVSAWEHETVRRLSGCVVASADALAVAAVASAFAISRWLRSESVSTKRVLMLIIFETTNERREVHAISKKWHVRVGCP